MRTAEATGKGGKLILGGWEDGECLCNFGGSGISFLLTPLVVPPWDWPLSFVKPAYSHLPPTALHPLAFVSLE